MICFEGKRRVLNEKEQARKELKMTEKERARKERKAEYNKKWYAANKDRYVANKEKTSENNKKWREANKENLAEYMRGYYATHPEYRKRAAERKKVWREKNPEHNNNYLQALAEKHPNGYVSSENRNGGNSVHWKGGTSGYYKHTEFRVNRLIVLNEAEWTCLMCGNEATEAHHLDRSKDNHNPLNLLAVCHKCHKEFHRNKECPEEAYA